MTMNEMNAWFESRGFEVKREWKKLSEHKGYYEFTISKDNNHVLGTYVWPEDQRAFMRRMLKSYETEFGSGNRIVEYEDIITPEFYDEQRKRAEVVGCCFQVYGYRNARDSLVLNLILTDTRCNNTYAEDITISPLLDMSNIGNVKRDVERHIDKLYGKVYKDRYPSAIIISDKSLQPDTFHIGDFAVKKYIYNDLKNTEEMYKIMWPKTNPYLSTNIKISNVIFNDPATIVFWSDGTKTVVKCQDDDIFDPEKGLAMAISKKALGNKGNYCNELKKWLPKKEESETINHLED